MVHQYKNNGYNMVLDVASGSVHVVDDLTYEVIALYEDHTLEEIIKELSSWDEKDVKESYGEVTELKDAGVLFTEDCYCLLYTSPSPRDVEESRMPSSA